jgi:MoxR-like ATPase
VLAAFLDRYGQARTEAFSGSHEASMLLKRAAGCLVAILPSELSGARVRSSVGAGNWASVPWIAVLDPRITRTTQEGVYPVILIREDLTGLYATLAQGVTKLLKAGQQVGYERMREQAAELRPHLESLSRLGFAEDEIFLGRSRLARDYAVSTIVSKYYSRDELPDLDIDSDLAALNRVYAALIDDGVIGSAPRRVASSSPKVLSVYVSDARRDGFEQAARRGYWGWERIPKPATAASVGDLIVFAIDDYRGSQLLEATRWRERRLPRLVIGRIERAPFRSDEALLPEELTAVASYPWKTQFTVLGQEQDVALDPGAALNAATVEALRLDAVGDEAEGLASVEGSPLLMRYLAGEPERTASTTAADVRRLAVDFAESVDASGMRLDRGQITAFLAGVMAKPFAILTGQSGSGKTQLAKRLGEWCGSRRYLVVPVRPDWTGPEYLFGYPDGLAPRVHGRAVWAVPDTLEFLIRAREDESSPYVLVLDEMNLAHVERYFADFLSAIESREPVLPELELLDGLWVERDSGRIPLPSNLIVIGTVNVDETTYMFSPKVLDRAFVHEFRVAADDLDPQLRRPKPLSEGNEADRRHFVRLLQDDEWQLHAPHPEQAVLAEELRSLHRHLALANLDFGHRTFFEALRFASFAHCAGLGSSDSVLDEILMTKLLPKVHGSRQRLETRLRALEVMALGETDDNVDPRLPRSAAKLERMLQVLEDAQFVTFTE